MSISLEASPFKDKLPCVRAFEKHGIIYCGKSITATILDSTSCPCSDCRSYEPVSPGRFSDYTSRGIKTTWVRKEDSTCYWYECSNCGERLPHNRWGSEYFSSYCPSCGSKMYCEDEELTSVPPGLYRHFKGNLYYVLYTAKHTETDEAYVVYRPFQVNYRQVFVRPLKMFVEQVEDLSTGYRGPRFFSADSSK